MRSKLIVNLGADAKPCINVLMPLDSSGFTDTDFNLADRTLGMFFENLQHESDFLGVIRNPDANGNSVRTIIPMPIPQVLEWLCVFFAGRTKTDEAHTRVLELFDELKGIYFNERYSGGVNPDTIEDIK